MSAWSGEELDKIGATDELQLASLRQDGTLRKPVTIWVVRHGDHLYVRSVNGHYPAQYVDPMVGAAARASTLELIPR
jgi:hypothetical protein